MPKFIVGRTELYRAEIEADSREELESIIEIAFPIADFDYMHNKLDSGYESCVTEIVCQIESKAAA